MNIAQFQVEGWYLILSLIILGLAALGALVTVVTLRRRYLAAGRQGNPTAALRRLDAGFIENEIARLCEGGSPNEVLIKQLSPEERVLFEVSAIDALNKAPREEQQRVRAALVKCGYDEQCARRVMAEEVSDRVRAAALLRLLRPQSRDAATEDAPPVSGEEPAARAATKTTGPLEIS